MQVITESRKRPDFIFPRKAEYFDPSFKLDLLTMLAAKSTCKDRWPQILPEAKKITVKHLLTLEPWIFTNQTEMMQGANIQLIVPESISCKLQRGAKIIFMDSIKLYRASSRTTNKIGYSVKFSHSGHG